MTTTASFMLAALVALQLSAQAPSKEAPAKPPFPPPGRLIDLGGWRLHLQCTGNARVGQPTVILEAGVGDFSVDWSLVQPGVSRMTRVCSYDRAGSGWSDLGPRPRTRQQIAWELHTLLQKAGVQPPYVLVGHSEGGLLVRTYASTYRSQVAGMVLVDSGDERGALTIRDGKPVAIAETATGDPIPPVKTSEPLRDNEIPERFRTMIETQIKQLAPHANDPPRDKLPVEAQRMRTWSISQVKHHITNDNPSNAEELAALLGQRRQKHPFGDLPLIVLTRGLTDAKTPDEARRIQQADLANLSTAGKQVIAARGGHHIPLDEPDVVIASIRDVLTAAR
jgi:pimeloyl-ACP methyl ester carboxylesterase